MKTIHKIVALYCEGEKVLAYRDPVSGRVSLPELGGSNPVRDCGGFASVFGSKPVVERTYPEIALVKGDIKTIYHPFVTTLLPQTELGSHMGMLEYDGFEDFEYEPSAYRIICRHFFFMPIYGENKRTIPLEKEVAEVAEFRLDCLRHFHRYIPSGEIKAYAALIEAPSSPTRLSRAFHYLEGIYGFKEADYLKYRDDTNALRRDIR